jgi:hypothetical protein
MAKVWVDFLRVLVLILVTVVAVGTMPVFGQITWPAPGEACYGCTTNPNCIWTCPNGSHGSANVATELSCKTACRSSCGPSANCWLI